MSFTIEQGCGVDKFARQTVLADGVPYTVTSTWCVLPKLERETNKQRTVVRLPHWVIEREIEPMVETVTRLALLSPDCRGRRRLQAQAKVTCEVNRGVRLPDYDTAAFYRFRIDLSRVSSGQGEDGSTIAILPRLIEVDHFRL